MMKVSMVRFEVGFTEKGMRTLGRLKLSGLDALGV